MAYISLVTHYTLGALVYWFDPDANAIKRGHVKGYEATAPDDANFTLKCVIERKWGPNIEIIKLDQEQVAGQPYSVKLPEKEEATAA